MTIYATRKGDKNPKEVLNGALATCEPFHLSVRDIECSNEFTKTVFVQFEPSQSLSRLSNAFKQASATHDEYELNPHLSLIYKKMAPEVKSKVAASVRLPFKEVLFDSVKAIVSPKPVRSREDVEAWRVVAAQTLRK